MVHYNLTFVRKIQSFRDVDPSKQRVELLKKGEQDYNLKAFQISRVKKVRMTRLFRCFKKQKCEVWNSFFAPAQKGLDFPCIKYISHDFHNYMT